MDAPTLNDRSLTLDAVFFSAGDRRILRGVHVRVQPGEICGLFGRNGSGKSTLLKIGAGFLRGDSGLTIIDDERFHQPGLAKRYRKLAYLPQEAMLPLPMTVSRLVSHSPNSHRLRDDPRLSDVMRFRIGTLSAGMLRYLEVQLLLSLDRSYYLLDEPFTGVEPLLIDALCASIRSAASAGAGFLITDHYHHFLVPVATKAYLMEEGRCRCLAPATSVANALKQAGYLR